MISLMLVLINSSATQQLNLVKSNLIFATQSKQSEFTAHEIIKHVMTSPEGDSEFCFPETLNVEEH